MTDQHLGEALSALLDDELAPAARREAQAHLDDCSACRVELEAVAFARAAVRALPVRGLPPARWEDLLEDAADVAPVAPVRSGRRALWAAAAAAAAVLAVMLPDEPRVAPALPSFVDSHAARASVTGDPVTELAPIVPVSFGP